MRKFTSILIVHVLLISACSEPEQTVRSNTSETRSPRQAAPQLSGTQKMALELRDIKNQAAPALNYHLNAQRAEAIRLAMNGKSGAELIRLKFKYALELLNAGQTETAISTLEQLVPTNAGEFQINDNSRTIYEILALAYLRRGEQQNCIANHSPESCIVPILGDGIHVLPSGSKKAIEVYQALIKQYPDDLQSRWLLNLAYMTIGDFPDGVPDGVLIPKLQQLDLESSERFRDIASKAGLDVSGLSGGVCMEDFDGDGHLDIMCSSYGLDHQVRLFVNNSDGTFRETTEAAGLKGIVSGLNMIHGDYNNDGFVDVLLLRGAWLKQAGNHPNSLLANNGDGTFDDVTFEAGLTGSFPTQTATFADFNLDGWLDIFIGNESPADIVNPCEMYLNNRDGTFREVAKSWGLDYVGYVKGVVAGDFDNDNLPDLFISDLIGGNKLFKNMGGKSSQQWQFKDVSDVADIGNPKFSFPAWFWDYNNDGWQDLFVAAYQFDREGQVGYDFAAELIGQPIRTELSRLYRNNGDGTFDDVTEHAQVNRVMYAMGSNYGDLDNDGWQDFYVGTGAPDLRSVIPNRMFRNQLGNQFQEITYSGGFGHIQKGHGVAFGDFDHDGDQDIYCVMGGAYEGDLFRNVLFENPGNDNHWITLQLVGTKSNRSAIGARVSVLVETTQGQEQEIHRTVRTGGSFGASSLQLEIGLGQITRIKKINIRWPTTNDVQQTHDGVASNRAYRIVEGKREVEELIRVRSNRE